MRAARKWCWVLVALCTLGMSMGRADAQEKAGADLDKLLRDTLRDIHNRGADLYNSGDTAGCYRLFQGALLTARPLLGHRPEVQQAIERGLASAENEPSLQRRAFALHHLIEDVREKMRAAPARTEQEKGEPQKPAASPPRSSSETGKPRASLSPWERLGGEAGVGRIVDDWVALVANDPRVNFTRGGRFKPTESQVAELKKLLVAFFSQALGGPLRYNGQDMKASHRGMGITDAEFDAGVADLRKALEGQGVATADVHLLLKVVEATRKDIVEPKAPDAQQPKDEQKPKPPEAPGKKPSGET